MKVSYLFGAGASAGVLPVVNAIPPALVDFKEIYLSNRSGSNEKIENHSWSYRESEEDFLIALNIFLREIPKHASIDTYAKKLRITGNGVLYNQLKTIFSAYLIHAQLTREVDRRYDSFFASILGTHSTDFISDINILTWNYDFQFEKAYSAFSNTDSLSTTQAMLNVNFIGSDRVRDKAKICIYKLNGTAGFFDTRWRNHYAVSDSFSLPDQRYFFNELNKLYAYSRLSNTYIRSSLTFAWDNERDDFYDFVIKKVKETEILVIIGYSIPFFNRAIDRRIIQEIAPTVKRVYIQDINPDNVLDSLTSLWPTENIPHKIINSVDQFYVPPQL